MRKQRIFNICVTAGITIAIILLGVFMFRASYLRTFEAFMDLCRSIGYYVCSIFGKIGAVTPTVTEYSEVMQWNIQLPAEYEQFKSFALDYVTRLIDRENFIGYWSAVGSVLWILARMIVIVLPCILVFVLIVRELYKRGNTRYNADTVPLKAFKKIARVTYQPIKSYVREYISFLKAYRVIWIVWLGIWAFHLNAVSIVMGALAYYFYFVMSFDIANLYVQVCKLLIDLQMIFRYFPWWILAIGAWYLFNRWRKGIALGRLRHFEARNCEFINELPIVSITCGSMGKKKTTMITDMALSQEVMFRQQALAIIQQTDLKFPYFPWICFERELQRCMEYGTVYSLATVKAWVRKKRKRFFNHGNAEIQLYGYDCKRYGTVYDDTLKESGLFDVLEIYAQAYFIYVIESSLIVSNYAIRADGVSLNVGNFPLWLCNFFPDKQRRKGRYSHILDFDVLRLGKKVLEKNPNAGSFEFGVVAISEIGKERGNNLELREVKKGTEETNQKNDLFNAWLKMCRHSATVDHIPFIKVFTDEQRPESWGADARDLCDIMKIISSEEQRLTLPFYTIEEMLSEWAFQRFLTLYSEFRFKRGDNTLLVHVLKGIVAWLWRRNIKIYNRYGYSMLNIEKERGTMDGKKEKRKYYLMNAKIYSRRFSTDCFSDYFNELSRRSKVGLKDYIEYASERATVEELKMQNSYFINALYKETEDKNSA